jgi:hypothetical protein
MAALSGNDVEMRRRLAQLESMSGDEPLPDGTRSPRSALVLIRGLFGFDRPDRMLADSREAVQLETDSATPWFAVARASLGYAAFVIGDMALARANLSEAAHASATPTTIRLIALSTLALCEAEHGNTARSASLATQAMQIVTDHTIEAIPHAIFAYTAYGRSLADAGRLVEAAVALEEGLKSRRQLPGLSPWPLIQHLTVMASVATRSRNDAAADQILAKSKPSRHGQGSRCGRPGRGPRRYRPPTVQTSQFSATRSPLGKNRSCIGFKEPRRSARSPAISSCPSTR